MFILSGDRGLLTGITSCRETAYKYDFLSGDRSCPKHSLFAFIFYNVRLIEQVSQAATNLRAWHAKLLTPVSRPVSNTIEQSPDLLEMLMSVKPNPYTSFLLPHLHADAALTC